MFRRIVGVFQLNAAIFEEIEHDRSATWQAALVVAVVGLLVGLGSTFVNILGSDQFFGDFLSTLLGAFIGWLIWSAVTYFVGTALFAGKADVPEMLRVIGFATAPLALGIIPCIGGIIGALWAMAAGFVAVRQGLDLDNARATVTVLVGFGLYLLAILLLGFISPFN